jgi:hypothetical protein
MQIKFKIYLELSLAAKSLVKEETIDTA